MVLQYNPDFIKWGNPLITIPKKDYRLFAETLIFNR